MLYRKDASITVGGKAEFDAALKAGYSETATELNLADAKERAADAKAVKVTDDAEKVAAEAKAAELKAETPAAPEPAVEEHVTLHEVPKAVEPEHDSFFDPPPPKPGNGKRKQ
jgi:hypothetical protein